MIQEAKTNNHISLAMRVSASFVHKARVEGDIVQLLLYIVQASLVNCQNPQLKVLLEVMEVTDVQFHKRSQELVMTQM
jgi:hypothetical protein